MERSLHFIESAAFIKISPGDPAMKVLVQALSGGPFVSGLCSHGDYRWLCKHTAQTWSTVVTIRKTTLRNTLQQSCSALRQEVVAAKRVHVMSSTEMKQRIKKGEKGDFTKKMVIVYKQTKSHTIRINLYFKV